LNAVELTPAFEVDDCADWAMVIVVGSVSIAIESAIVSLILLALD
jgi:hypothetical protein